MVIAQHHLPDNPPSETHTTYRSSHPFPLPYDILETITAHLHDLRALKACSLICRSWYIAAAPHLHYTLTFTGDNPEIGRRQLEPLSKLHELGLIHLVKTIWVKQGSNTRWFAPGAFSDLDLRNFSAFTNVHTLKLQNVGICDFIPGAERYFGPFSQALRSIILYDPRCTPRQLSYFLSLFSNLDNIGIRNTCTPELLITATSEMEPVPFSALKLRGRLALQTFWWPEMWKHLITSNSDLRFRRMVLRGSTSCAPILFEACAETLETLQLGVIDGTGGG